MGAAVAGVTAGPDRLPDVRAWWRIRHPPPGLGQRLDVLYTVAITGAILGTLAYGTASQALAQVVTPAWLATYGPALALLVLVAIAHWGAYHGPVVFSVPDVAFLLGAPLPRRGLAARRLVLALAGAAAAGAVIAGLVVVGLAGEGRGVQPGVAAGVAVGFAEVGILGVAGAWAVQCSARRERALRRATWPAAAVAAAVAAVHPGRGAGAAEWIAALAGLTLVGAVAATAAVRRSGDCPAERHLRRAEARASATASLASLDARTARRALETVGERTEPRASTGLRRPGIGALAIPWRDAASALRAPGRVAEAVALAAGATVLCVLNTDRPLVLAAAVLVAYLGASRMLWPLRSELDTPGRMRVLLRARSGRVLLAHTLLPVAVTTAAAVSGALGCAVAGALGAHGAAVALVAVAVVPLVGLCAAMSARRGGRLPTTVLVTAMAVDPSGGASGLLMWFAYWPAVAVTAGAVPLLLVAGSGAEAAVFAAGWILAATALLAYLVSRDPPEA